jgi:FKBP-type peptidyl-prolyl cis-trans isomerase
MTRLRLLAFALLTVGFTACLDTTAPEYNTVENTTFDPSLGVDLSAFQSTDLGVYYRDITVGTGPTIAAGQDNFMFYRSYLSTGVEVDSTQPPNPPVAFQIGTNPPSLITGFEIGVQGMKVGGRRQILVPPAVAYGLGDRLRPDNTVLIPGNSVLVFDVQLVNADGSPVVQTAQ